MANSFFNNSTTLLPLTKARAGDIEGKFNQVSTGFDGVETVLNGKATTAQGAKADTAVQSVNSKTGTAITLTKADVGLGNADNTSDANKPISTATQTALNAKAPLASPAFTGSPTAPTAPAGTSTDQLATTAFVLNQAFSSTLPAQGGNTGKYLQTDGSTASWQAAQAPLISGTNIKTINGSSVLGSGDLTIAAGTGDVVGPASSTDNGLVLFSGTTGKLVKATASSGLVKISSGVVSTAVAGTDFQSAITATGILNGAGTGSVSAATANTDYLVPALANTAVTGFKTATFNSQATIATTTGAITIDWTTAQNQKQTEPTGTITYTFTAPPGPCHLQLIIDSDGTSTAQTINWPGTVIQYGATWAGANNKKSVINFWYDGTNYHMIGSNQV